MKSKVKYKTTKGITKTGTKQAVTDKELFKRIRRRLGLTTKQLPNALILKVIDIANKNIAQWLLDNSEGFFLPNMGVLAISKYLPKEYKENKEETLEKIKNLPYINEQKRHILLKRYNVDIGRKLDIEKFNKFKEVVPRLNLSTYFYDYRIMWFNHNNCITEKARVYWFTPIRPLKTKMWENILENHKDYYEWNFSDFKSRVKTRY